MSSPQEWFKSIPTITKTYMVSVFAFTFADSVNLISPLQIYLNYDLVFKNYQFWRIITNFFFFGKFGFNWLINIYLLYTHSSALELNYFNGENGVPEYLFVLFFCASICLSIALSFPFLGLYFLSQSLVCSILYIRTRKEPFSRVALFGFVISNWQLPFMYIFLDILTGQSPIHSFMGIGIGHIYHFLVDIVPKVYGVNILRCPSFFYKLFSKSPSSVFRDSWFNRGRGYRLN
ncbi:Derlin-2 [Bonamia ostreae]|uniref:Derlin n=1 Tax=Bonamia ostreae TaxID=126728 RepID=A0ABV2AHF4_9EUKA